MREALATMAEFAQDSYPGGPRFSFAGQSTSPADSDARLAPPSK